MIDVRKHQAGVNCLPSEQPHKSTMDKLVDTDVLFQQICFIKVRCLIHPFLYFRALIWHQFWVSRLLILMMNSFVWHSVTSWHFCYPPPHDPPVYCSQRGLTARFVCDPSCELPPLPTLWRLRGHNTSFYISYKSAQKCPKPRKTHLNFEFFSCGLSYDDIDDMHIENTVLTAMPR